MIFYEIYKEISLNKLLVLKAKFYNYLYSLCKIFKINQNIIIFLKLKKY